MKVLLSGVCGFVGSSLAHALLDQEPALRITGIDNFSRPGSHLNRAPLLARGVKVVHADVRSSSDLETLPHADWIIDAAANPSVLAGVDGLMSSRQVIEHNLYGTANLLELAKNFRAGFVLLSTSRVYSIRALTALKVEVHGRAFRPLAVQSFPPGLSTAGIAEELSTIPPISLYGTTKIASEVLALEYGETFDLPIWIDRCGVIAGAGQFGRPDQGIFAFWINAYLRGAALKYIGFDGTGFQTRDCFHPRDLARLVAQQIDAGSSPKPRIVNLGGGEMNSISLLELSEWCGARFGRREVAADRTPRRFDLPWVVMDSHSACTHWDWRPAYPLESILEEIATHAERNPHWLEISAAV